MYCTLDDIKMSLPKEIIVQLTDDANPSISSGGVVNKRIVDAAIKESGALIDSFVGGRYPLPFPNTPPILKKVCVDLSVYDLHERCMAFDDNPGMRKRYDNAIKLLNQIADGEILLGVPPSAESPGFFTGSLVEGGPAQFTMNSMRGL